MLSWLPGAIVGAIGLIFGAIKLLNVDLARKSLGYQVTLFRSVLTGGESIKKQLELRFNGEPISDPHLLIVEIINKGRLPIKAEDYEEPLTITLDERSRVLTAEVAGANTKSLMAALGPLSHEANRVGIPKKLLNAQDSFTVKILAQLHPGNVEVLGRVAGVSNIKEFNDERNSLRWGLGIGVTMLLVGLAWLLFSVPTSIALKAATPVLYIALGAVMLVATVIARIVHISRQPKPPAQSQDH